MKNYFVQCEFTALYAETTHQSYVIKAPDLQDMFNKLEVKRLEFQNEIRKEPLRMNAKITLIIKYIHSEDCISNELKEKAEKSESLQKENDILRSDFIRLQELYEDLKAKVRTLPTVKEASTNLEKALKQTKTYKIKVASAKPKKESQLYKIEVEDKGIIGKEFLTHIYWQEAESADKAKLLILE